MRGGTGGTGSGASLGGVLSGAAVGAVANGGATGGGSSARAPLAYDRASSTTPKTATRCLRMGGNLGRATRAGQPRSVADRNGRRPNERAKPGGVRSRL